MMKKPKLKLTLLFVIAISSIFCSCSNRDGIITGKFKLSVAIHFDTVRIVSISRMFHNNPNSLGEEVPGFVYEFGHNDEFIIAKQHPTNGWDGGYKIDSTVTNFYIVDVKEQFPQHQLLGKPLTSSQFDSMRNVLKIQDIKFDRDFPVSTSKIKKMTYQ